MYSYNTGLKQTSVIIMNRFDWCALTLAMHVRTCKDT